MSKIVVFAGTTEGRTLSEWLCDKRIKHTLCVATEYGEQVLSDHPLAIVCRGRMDQKQMEEFFQREGAELIVDATHPYAYLVTDNIRKAAKKQNLTYLRLLREGMNRTLAEEKKQIPSEYTGQEAVLLKENSAVADFSGKIEVFPSAQACAQYLAGTSGTIFLTTGSKELPVFCEKEEVKTRLIARVLPGKESIAICESLGLPGKQIVAMQGPFSTAMNKALLQNYDASILVTKASGKAGGFAEKIQAANELGVRVCIIGRPTMEEGYGFEEVCEKLERFAGIDAGFAENPGCQTPADDRIVVSVREEQADKTAGCQTPAEDKNGTSLEISLIGCGMGHPENLTIEAARALEKAEIVMGAPRLLRDMKITKESHPWYLAKDILPFLERQSREAEGKQGKSLAILFSGDTGFFSGSKKLHAALKEAVASGTLSAKIRIYPGISSIVNLAAELGESWEDARILSIHGMGEAERWSRKLMETVKREEKTFVLLSGVHNLQTIGELLEDMEGIRIFAGYQMSYPEQEILELTAEDCRSREKEGLYSLFILNENSESEGFLTHGLSDDSFIRGKVPMTKEEVRTVSISRLKLSRDAIVYDVGSGTGSVAVEIARLSPSIMVYAIERKPQALELIRQNKEKFALSNLIIVPGEAPEALEGLPAPTHVFIGGSGGQMKMIVQNIFTRNPEARIVANAVSFETLQELMQVEKQFDLEDFDIVQLAATRTRKLGNYHMTQGENPVWICSFQKKR